MRGAGGGGGVTTNCGNVKTSKIYSLTLIIDQTHPSSLCSDNIHEEGKSMGEEWMEGNMVIFWKGWKGQIRVKRPCCQLQDTPQRCKDKLFQKIRAGRQARIQDFSQGGKMLAPLEIFCSIYKKLNLFRANRKKIKALPDCFFYPTLFLTILFCLLRDCRYFLGALARFNSSRRQISRGPGNLLPPPHCVRPCG